MCSWRTSATSRRGLGASRRTRTFRCVRECSRAHRDGNGNGRPPVGAQLLPYDVQSRLSAHARRRAALHVFSLQMEHCIRQRPSPHSPHLRRDPEPTSAPGPRAHICAGTPSAPSAIIARAGDWAAEANSRARAAGPPTDGCIRCGRAVQPAWCARRLRRSRVVWCLGFRLRFLRAGILRRIPPLGSPSCMRAQREMHVRMACVHFGCMCRRLGASTRVVVLRRALRRMPPPLDRPVPLAGPGSCKCAAEGGYWLVREYCMAHL
jgi:hypothetical protein